MDDGRGGHPRDPEATVPWSHVHLTRSSCPITEAGADPRLRLLTLDRWGNPVSDPVELAMDLGHVETLFEVAADDQGYAVVAVVPDPSGVGERLVFQRCEAAP
jgi:hypothetical protein